MFFQAAYNVGWEKSEKVVVFPSLSLGKTHQNAFAKQKKSQKRTQNPRKRWEC